MENSLLSKKAKKGYGAGTETVTFQKKDPEPEPYLSFLKVGTVTGTITFQKSEPEPEQRWIKARANPLHRVTIDVQKPRGSFNLEFVDGLTHSYRWYLLLTCYMRSRIQSTMWAGSR